MSRHRAKLIVLFLSLGIFSATAAMANSATQASFETRFGGGDAVGMIGSLTSFVDSYGNEVAAYAAGVAVRVRLEDHNFNNPGRFDTVAVTLSSLTTGDAEVLTLLEVAKDSGIFEGSLATQTNAPAVLSDGRLQVQVGEDIEAMHMDFNGLLVSVGQARMEFATASFVDDQGRPTVELLENGTARVRVINPEGNGNPGLAETLTVQLRSLYAGDQEETVLTETGPDTSVFEGSIPLSFNFSASPGNGALETTNRGPKFPGEQVTASYGPYNSTAHTVGSRVAFLNLRGQEVTSYSLGATVRVRIEDQTRNQAAVLDSFTVHVRSRANGDDESVTMTETSPASGIFEGSVPNSVTAGPSGDGVLSAAAGQMVEAKSPNANRPTSTTARAVFLANFVPLAVDDTAQMLENQGEGVSVPVLANDSDPESGSLTIASFTQGSKGTVTAELPGQLKYTPNTGKTGQDTFTYLVTDAEGGEAVATVTITVIPSARNGNTSISKVIVVPVDDNPVAVNDAATVVEDSGANAINVLANDTDADGGPISVSSVTQPANGTVVITGGGTGLTYSPNANYCNTPPGTPDTFTYALTPGGSTATVSVSVTCADDSPVAVNDAATVVEDSGANAINVLANDTDVDGGPKSVSSVTQPANGTVVITGGGTGVIYAPNANYCNNPPGTFDTFTYTLAPGGSTAMVSVSVTCADDVPVVDLDTDDSNGTSGSDFAATFTEGNPAVLLEDPTDATTTDVDSPTLASLTVTITNLLDTGSEILSTDVTGTSITANYVAATGVLTLNGPDTLANFQTVLRKVRYQNTDVDPDTTPRVIHFVANDSAANSNTAVSTVTIVAIDTPPTAVNDSATVNEDSGANPIPVLTNDTDPDNGPISITAVTQPANGTVVITGGGTGLTYAPNANYCNSVSGPLDTFTYTPAPSGSTATVSVTVTCVNDTPVANANATSVAEDGVVNVAVLSNDTDADGDSLTVSSVTQGAHGVVSINPDKTVKYTPALNYNGPDSFTYTISDGNGGTATATVTVTVTPVNDAPVAVNDTATVVAGSAVTVSVLANDADVDGPGLSVTAVTQGANGSVAVNANQTVTYTAGLFVGTDSFTYMVSDGAGGTATATVAVTVTAPPRVTTGLQARYNFNEGSGSTVNDTSSVGTPLNLTIANPAAVSWLPGALSVNTSTMISSAGAAGKVINAVRTSNSVTVEAWIAADNLTQAGPARIVSMEKNSTQRNIIFGQSGNRFETLLRTSSSTSSLLSPVNGVSLNLSHVVYTRSSAGQAVMYINGVQVSSQTASGSLSAWDAALRLALANEIGGSKPWLGDLYLVALYGRDLTSTEVKQNFLAGSEAN